MSTLLARLSLGLGLALALLLESAPSHAAEPLPELGIDVFAGVRAARIRSTGFDPFADSDELVQLSLGAAGTLWTRDALSLAVVGSWDYGGRSSSARGAPTELSVQRVAFGPEGRYRLLAPLYLFARFAPAAVHSSASLRDDAIGVDREARHWVFGWDGTLGAALAVFDPRAITRRRLRLWLVAEGGYGWARSSELVMQAVGASVPARTVDVDLGVLELRGPLLRVSASVSF